MTDITTAIETVREYAFNCEAAICGEWCSGKWPGCGHSRHGVYREALAALTTIEQAYQRAVDAALDGSLALGRVEAERDEAVADRESLLRFIDACRDATNDPEMTVIIERVLTKFGPARLSTPKEPEEES